MSGEQLKELLQDARDAENSEDEERAAELYQQIVDEYPHSRAAKIAGKRLIDLDDEERHVEEPSREWTCSQCGNTAFVEGNLEGERSLIFESDESEDLAGGEMDVRARFCRTCGSIDPYVDLSAPTS